MSLFPVAEPERTLAYYPGALGFWEASEPCYGAGFRRFDWNAKFGLDCVVVA